MEQKDGSETCGLRAVLCWREREPPGRASHLGELGAQPEPPGEPGHPRLSSPPPTQTATAAGWSHAVLVIRLGLGGPGNPFELGPCRLEGPAATLACSAASRSLPVSLPSAFHMRMRVVASFTESS